ncbi:MAG: AbrB/MazE/SpoVT family DNA-binding domain-containing protein [Candidatus Daviesbacteria bacterium]|nr:AbrB/MazE/SpoVT family DNA-binding domain-containing protein [Candidatus Daviesbacteria bacterium]
MKIGSFATTNNKGQIVIPKEMRDILAIDTNVVLNLILAGKGIYLYPVTEFLTKAEGESSYLKLLEKTKGTWKNENWDKLREKKSKLELESSNLRKNVW